MEEPKSELLEIAIVSAGSESRGTIEKSSFPRPYRVRRGLKNMGKCWLAALASFPIPVAHFFTVPIFMAAGPVAFGLSIFTRTSLRGARGKCPKCGHDIPASQHLERWPLFEWCRGCGGHLRIDRV